MDQYASDMWCYMENINGIAIAHGPGDVNIYMIFLRFTKSAKKSNIPV